MTSSKEKITVRISNLAAEDIKKAIERQDQYTTPDAYMYYNATVTVWSEDETEPIPGVIDYDKQYSKDWTKEEFYDCPEVKQWLKDGGMEGWTEEDLAGHVVGGEEVWEAFERSATYLEGLEDIADDIKRCFEPDAIVTIE